MDTPKSECYSDDTELANYFDEDDDMELVIHSVDKLSVHYYLVGFVVVVVVPNNWHNYCIFEIDLMHNSSCDYECLKNVYVIVRQPEYDIASVATKRKWKEESLCQ